MINKDTWDKAGQMRYSVNPATGRQYLLKEIANELGISLPTLKHYSRKNWQARPQPTQEMLQQMADFGKAKEVREKIETKTELINGTMITTSNMLLSIQNFEDKTPADIMILHGFDPFAWELLSTSNKVWNGTSKLQGTYTMYSSTVKVKPIEMCISFDYIKQCFDELAPKEWSVEEIINNNGLFATVEIFDIHAGKLAWDEETGDNYDLDIAVGIVKNIINQNVEYLSTVKPSVIIFPIGNDLFQVDNEEKTTSHGTRQDVDTRPKKIFKEVIELIYESIGKLSQKAPVKTLFVPSNHDENTSYYLSEVMSKAFENNPNVIIDTNPKTRKYIQIGKVLLGYTHSDEESKEELKGLMQKEVPDLWGKSEYREFHFGHLHTEQTVEKHGFKQRWIPSISGPDHWHFKKGYVANDRTSMTFVYDEDKGLDTIKYFRGAI